MLKRYKRKHDDFTESLRSYCMKNSIGSSLARTDVPFDEFLTSVLRRGGLVA